MAQWEGSGQFARYVRTNLMLLEYAGGECSHIVAEHGDYQATEIAAELMAKLYAI